MAYSSKNSRKPMEAASKTNHTFVIRSPIVQEFLISCAIAQPPDPASVLLHATRIATPDHDPIRLIVAIDGGLTEVPVQEKYPSSAYTFYNFGGLLFEMTDLEQLRAKAFIDPEDMAKLRNMQRFQFVLPTVNLRLKNCVSLVDSVRLTIFNFFTKVHDGEKPLIAALRWLLFQEYDPATAPSSWMLASCPACRAPRIAIPASTKKELDCPHCGKPVYLTDVLRLHEVVDNEQGARGILGYLMAVLEQLLFVHLVKTVWELKRGMLAEMLFILDRPLAFFGQTSNLHDPMRHMLNYFADDPTVRAVKVVGVEKSGAFVEHADAVRDNIPPGHAIILGNDYIYRYITPGAGDPHEPFGKTSYYGSKAIYRALDGNMYVLTLPTRSPLLDPTSSDLMNFDLITHTIAKLKCHMYDNALVPVALANKLVSLSDHPSRKILTAFAKAQLGRS